MMSFPTKKDLHINDLNQYDNIDDCKLIIEGLRHRYNLLDHQLKDARARILGIVEATPRTIEDRDIIITSAGLIVKNAIIEYNSTWVKPFVDTNDYKSISDLVSITLKSTCLAPVLTFLTTLAPSLYNNKRLLHRQLAI